MKKIYFLSLVTIALSTSALAQNFTFVDGDLIEKEISLEEFESADCNILNESDVGVTFGWEVVELDNPFGWEYSLCDYPNCYTDGEFAGTMSEVTAGSETAFLKINIYATAEGVGTYSYAVWDTAFPDDRDTVTFILTASDVSSLDELTTDKISVTSTNANGFNISNSSNQSGSYEVYNISGQRVTNGTIGANQTKLVSTIGFNPGLYFIAFQRNGAMIETEKVVVQ